MSDDKPLADLLMYALIIPFLVSAILFNFHKAQAKMAMLSRKL